MLTFGLRIVILIYPIEIGRIDGIDSLQSENSLLVKGWTKSKWALHGNELQKCDWILKNKDVTHKINKIKHL